MVCPILCSIKVKSKIKEYSHIMLYKASYRTPRESDAFTTHIFYLTIEFSEASLRYKCGKALRDSVNLAGIINLEGVLA